MYAETYMTSHDQLEDLDLRISITICPQFLIEPNESAKIRFVLSEIEVTFEPECVSHAIINGKFAWIGQKLEVFFRGHWYAWKLKASEDEQRFQFTLDGSEKMSVRASVVFEFPEQLPENSYQVLKQIGNGSYGVVSLVCMPFIHGSICTMKKINKYPNNRLSLPQTNDSNTSRTNHSVTPNRQRNKSFIWMATDTDRRSFFHEILQPKVT